MKKNRYLMNMNEEDKSMHNPDLPLDQSDWRLEDKDIETVIQIMFPTPKERRTDAERN